VEFGFVKGNQTTQKQLRTSKKRKLFLLAKSSRHFNMQHPHKNMRNSHISPFEISDEPLMKPTTTLRSESPRFSARKKFSNHQK
jgi:hypothetical protein